MTKDYINEKLKLCLSTNELVMNLIYDLLDFNLLENGKFKINKQNL